MTPKQVQKLHRLRKDHPEYGRRKLAALVGVSENTIRWELEKPVHKLEKDSPLKDKVRQLISAKPASVITLMAATGASHDELGRAIEDLSKSYAIEWRGGDLALSKPSFGRIPLDFLNGPEYVIGLVADTHLACREERLDALHAHYDLMASEGITTVLHAGNIVDGYIHKINGTSVLCTGVDEQANYVVDNYPARKGMKTYFITGDDHEVWFMRDGLNFGWYLQKLAEDNGREDLVYIGHVESDVDVKTPKGVIRIKVQHPGGGSAYARSYTAQKQCEAFQGGEKPQILVQGHYHVANYMPERNIHVIGLPGFQDQTVFARKKRLRMEVGGAILRFRVTEACSVSRVSVEFNMFFDRGFYKPFLRSDARLLKGHLTLSK